MIIDPLNSSLLIVDIQEKLIRKIFNNTKILNYLDSLIKIFSTLSLPIIYSEQYPEGLGETVKSIRDRLDLLETKKILKTSFSCFPYKNSKSKKKVLNTQQVVICGIEAHICVLQTSFDLKMAGFDVFLVNEAIGSRRQEDKDLAIERARDYGIHLVNFEMVLFELIRDSNHQDFKELSALISK